MSAIEVGFVWFCVECWRLNKNCNGLFCVSACHGLQIEGLPIFRKISSQQGQLKAQPLHHKKSMGWPLKLHWKIERPTGKLQPPWSNQQAPTLQQLSVTQSNEGTKQNCKQEVQQTLNWKQQTYYNNISLIYFDILIRKWAICSPCFSPVFGL